ncbi:molybdopterin-binding protein, partial [Stenotrophomonas maltophilia group sp. Smal13]
ALLTLYDLSKPVEPALRIEGIRLLFKEGGKRGVWLHPDGMDDAERARFKPRAPKGLEGAACAVITLSDRASEGTYEDVSGPTLVSGLKKLGGEVVAAEVLPDGIEPLAGHLQALAAKGVRLCLCTGGTGLGPRDLTPEALRSLNARPVHGLAQMVRALSAQHTPMAWLSRAEVVQLG